VQLAHVRSWLTFGAASYGSLARFRDVKRLKTFGQRCLIGFAGDMSDMQFIDRNLNAWDIEERETDGKNTVNAKQLQKYADKLFRHHWSKQDPLYNDVVIAGFDENDVPYLGSTDLFVSSFTSPAIGKGGLGEAIGTPLLRRYADSEEEANQLSEEMAVKAVKECMRLLWYRSCRAMETFTLAIVRRDGVQIQEELKVEDQDWSIAHNSKV
jgi:20S proteasome subunit beta 7